MELANGLGGIDPDRVGRPPVADRPSPPHVDRDRDPVRAMFRDETARERGIAQGGRADDDARGPGRERVRHGRLVAQAASDLDAHPVSEHRHDPPDRRPVDRHARAGAIEIDDVQPRRASVDEPLRDGAGVVREGRLAGEIALLQADDAPAPQIDGGQDVEPACQARPSVLTF